MKRSPRISRQEWSQRVSRWLKSGKSAEEYGAQIGVRGAGLMHWRWKLGLGPRSHVKPPASPAAPTRRRADEHGAPATLSFVELLPVVPPLEEARVEVVLSMGRRVLVPAGFDAVALGRIVTALEIA